MSGSRAGTAYHSEGITAAPGATVCATAMQQTPHGETQAIDPLAVAAYWRARSMVNEAVSLVCAGQTLAP